MKNQDALVRSTLLGSMLIAADVVNAIIYLTRIPREGLNSA